MRNRARKTIGALIRDGRLAKKWSQVRFAKAAKITQSNVAQLEVGSRVPSFCTLAVFSGLLGIPYGDLATAATDRRISIYVEKLAREVEKYRPTKKKKGA